MTTQTRDTTSIEMVREAFKGVMGREPKNATELKEWAASPEGKAATAFSAVEASRWGGASRS